MSGCPRTAGRAWRAVPVGLGRPGVGLRPEARQGRAGQRRALPVSARVVLTGRCGMICWKVMLLSALAWLGGDV